MAPEADKTVGSTEVRVPDGTLEARFWHCSESGLAARRVNEFMLAWITKLAKDQKDKKPLTYTPLSNERKKILLRNPMLLKDELDNLCRTFGLEPKDYYCIFDRKRIGCTKSP